MKIYVLATLKLLTELNEYYSKDLPESEEYTERKNEFIVIREAVCSYIISSGNLLNKITPIPDLLLPYIEELEKLSDLVN